MNLVRPGGADDTPSNRAHLVLLVLPPATAEAGYNGTAPPGIADASPGSQSSPPSGEGLNCRDIEQQVRVELNRMAPGFLVVSGVPEALLCLGSVDYSTDLRAELAEKLQVDALLEPALPRGEKGAMGRSLSSSRGQPAKS